MTATAPPPSTPVPAPGPPAAPASASVPAGAGARFLRSATTLSGGTVAAQLVWAASAPALTRLYGAEAFGAWALLASVVQILAALGVARYEFALVLARGPRAAGHLLAACLLLAAAAGVGLGLLNLALLGPLLRGFGGSLGAWGALACAPLATLTLVQLVLRSWALRLDRSGTLVRFLLAQAAAVAAFQLGAALLPGWRHADALLLGHLAGVAVGTALLAWSLAGSMPPRLLRHVTRAGMAAELARYRNLPLYSAPRSLVESLSARAVYFVFALFYGIEAAGLIVLASRVVQVPVSLLGGALRQAFFLRAVQLRDSPALGPLVSGVKTCIILAVVPGAVVLAANGPTLFGLVFGAAWAPAGLYAAALAGGAAMQTLTGWLNRLYEVHGRQRLALLLELGFLGALLAVQAGLALAGAGPLAVAASAGLVTLAYALGWLAVTLRLAGLSAELGGTLARLALTAVAAGATAWAIDLAAARAGGAPLRLAGGAVLACAGLALAARAGRRALRAAGTGGA